jgi:hypothetical protein
MPAEELRAVFAPNAGGTVGCTSGGFGGVVPPGGTGGDGQEPLGNPALRPKFEALLGAGTKPFECIGEVNECRAAVVLAARRPDRQATPLLQELAAEVTARPDAPTATEIEAMRHPVGASNAAARLALVDE